MVRFAFAHAFGNEAPQADDFDFGGVSRVTVSAA